MIEILSLNHIHRVMTNTEDVHGLKVTIDSEIGTAAGALKILRLDANGQITTSGSLTLNSNLKITGNLTVQGALIQDDNGEDDFFIQSRAGMFIMLDSNSTDVNAKFGVRAQGGTTNVFEVDEAGNVVILGNLDVKGTRSFFNTTDTQIKDNMITLNQGETGNGVTLTYAGIEVDRGKNGAVTNGKAVLRFNETLDKWEWSADSSTFQALPDDALVVHLAGAETVTGVKTFADGQIFDTFNLNSAKLRSDNTGLWLQRAHATKGTIGLGWDNTNARFGFQTSGTDRVTFSETGLIRGSAMALYGAAAKLSAEDANAALTVEANGTGLLYLQKAATGNVDILNGKFILTSAGAFTAASTIQSTSGLFQKDASNALSFGTNAVLSSTGGIIMMLDVDNNDTSGIFSVRANNAAGDLFTVDQVGAFVAANIGTIKGNGVDTTTLFLGDGNVSAFTTGQKSGWLRFNGLGLRYADVVYQPADQRILITATGAAFGDQTMNMLLNGTLTTVGDVVVQGGDVTGNTGSALRVFGDTSLTLASNADVIVMLDENNNQTDRAFRVRTNNAATDLFVCDEAGNLTMAGSSFNAAQSLIMDLKNAADTTLTLKNSTAGKVANLIVTGLITAQLGQLALTSATATAFVNLTTSSGNKGAFGLSGADVVITNPSVTAGGTQITGMGKQLMKIDATNGDADLTAGGTYKVNGDPVTRKSMFKRATVTIAAGQTSVTWTHNQGSTDYHLGLATDSASRHVRYANKAANTVDILIDDPDVTATNVDVILAGF